MCVHAACHRDAIKRKRSNCGEMKSTFHGGTLNRSAPRRLAVLFLARAEIFLLTAAAMTLTPFQQSVFALVRSVPTSRVTTYGELARVTGGSARAVGQCMRRNPLAPDSGCSPADEVP